MQKNVKVTWLQKHKKLVSGSAIVIGTYVIFLFVPIVSNYAQFPLYVIKCGGLPYVGNAAKNYKVPGDNLYSVTGLEEAFFCTEKEAETAGYRKSVYGKPINFDE